MSSAPRPSSRRPSAGQGLSRRTLAAAALSLVDAEGLEALTIRRLAAELAVTPMALYWHFRDKELLLDAVVEQVLTEVHVSPRAASDEPGAWRDRLREVFTALLTVMRRHPHVADLVPVRLLGSAAGLQISEECFAALAAAGFPHEQSARIGTQALHVLIALVDSEPDRGAPTAAGASERARQRAEQLRSLDPQRYAHVIACAPTLAGDGGDDTDGEDAWSAAGLDLLLGGITALHDALPA